MMTLDQAIKHCEEVAEEQEKLCKVNDSFNFSQPKWKECANEHRQLAERLKDYKRLLEQKSCGDAVSRKDLERLKRWRFSYDTNTTIPKSDLFVRLTDIRALPSVKSTQGWIPVSERLPKERIAVLVYCPERKNIYCACYEEKQWWIFGAYFKKIEEDVIAWMPLPKPY